MKKRFERLDWVLMFIPAAIVIVLCMVFMVLPERAGSIIEMLRVFLGDTFGFYYMLLGLVIRQFLMQVHIYHGILWGQYQ